MCTCLDCPAGRQVVAGVLVKFVNLGKGWRSRLFVLKHGVLRYYRVRAAACLCLICWRANTAASLC